MYFLCVFYVPLIELQEEQRKQMLNAQKEQEFEVLFTLCSGSSFLTNWHIN
jgi:hypothetical protein